MHTQMNLLHTRVRTSMIINKEYSNSLGDVVRFHDIDAITYRVMICKCCDNIWYLVTMANR